MATALNNSAPATAEEARADICAALCELAATCQTKPKYYRGALRALATHFGSPYAAIHVAQATSTVDERASSETDNIVIWEPVAEEALLESQAENVPIARLYGIAGTSLQAAVLAAPLCEPPDRPIGALVVVARCDNRPLAKALLGELVALAALTATRARVIEADRASGTGDDTALMHAFVKAVDFESLHDLAFAVTNSLKNKFACDQVTLGQARGARIRVLSISGLDNVYPKSPGVRHIRQAMEECLDEGEAICHQDEDKWSEQSVVTNHCLHRRWHAETGNSPVASLPLRVGNRCVAVVALSRPKQLPFTPGELAEIGQAVAPFGPVMELVAKADRGLVSHATDALKRSLRWLLAPRTYRRKAIAVAILAGIAFFCFGGIGYRITVSSQIAPTEILYFASPYEGTIKACHVDVGDRVEPGQPLYEMDAMELELQRDEFESDLEVLRLRANQALVSGDVKAAALASAEIRVLDARLAITRHNLAEARVQAPCRGTIVAGELSKRIGEAVPLGTPLMELVPEGDWSIELLVPEAVAAELQVGFQGRFACNARPGEPLHFTVTRIRPLPQPRNGKNVFIADATVEDNPAWMRAGMEGVARIDAGTRRVWWVALHRMIDYLRLTFWL
ncbi:MAG: HlyD family efflux transporter periplasmic adaptor subunit [Planctomycetes bacterium]|nr:HlyD family efflux transporter periplasmic adaptor subunit [Planctomycetota bacterium]